ncbi:hypothetical protein [Pseudoalteromonas denitrificans]|uniref:Tetratricopeptide repeat-containing protein n=1 Tax=Pseudoalteromonas denitrificans DSM 6059 TaxID=1123010 RepID=A0A1I1FDG2_9GAMM|nr:hypothetical protein [Pseudoalteromonas denitrificans]SFB97012.1 hypothetical protein SAMN02745724_00583 [Pseudoalteromonas denitrificans DSM 6059]
MKLSTYALLVTAGLGFTLPTSVKANMEDDLLKIQKRWAIVNYELKDDEQEKAFDDLIKQADSFKTQYTHSAEGYIWNGIIKSSYAGAKGGLGALSLVKDSKKSLEKALEINDKALAGSAYTSLATLYSQVPGWPIGFGSDKKAEENFKRALEINPNGIDPNYFYAQYLYDDRKYKIAKKHLVIAQHAKSRKTRPLADKSRQQEITELLTKVDKKLRKK